MAVFCALTVDQHKSLYKLIYKNILDAKSFDIKSFSNDLYNKVLNATKNQELALTYVSFVPSYAANMQTEDKEIRTIFKESKVDANDLIDKIDEWENNIENIQNYLGVANTSKEADYVSVEEARAAVSENNIAVASREEVTNVMTSLFALPEEKAKAVAAIYDRVARSWAKRFDKSPADFYNTLTFSNGIGRSFNKNLQFQNSNALFETRDGEYIGFNYTTDKVARERFDIPNLKKIGSGSDRDVYDLENGMVLKIAKTARGLEQNIIENDYVLQDNEIIPQVHEVGLNYNVVDKVEPADIYEYDVREIGGKWFVVGTNEFQQMEDPDNEKFIPAKSQKDAIKIKQDLQDKNIVAKFINAFKKAQDKDINNNSNQEKVLEAYDLSNIVLSYDFLQGDFLNPENWGIKDGKIIHLDGGTFNRDFIEYFRGKEGKDLEDKDFRDIYNKSKAAKKSFKDTDNNTMYQIVGEKAASSLADKSLTLLSKAKYMEDRGESTEAIFAATGWERGVDGKWRMDLPTDNFKLKMSVDKIFDEMRKADKSGNVVLLGSIINYPELFAAYPELEEMGVDIETGERTAGSMIWRRYNSLLSNTYNGILNLNPNFIDSEPKMLDVLSHEIQHAIQGIERFPAFWTTGDVNESNMKDYTISANEVEARNAAKRRGINDEEKEFLPISMTEDTARNIQTNINEIVPSKYRVLFQENNEKYTLDQKSYSVARAAVQIAEDGEAIIYALTNPNVSSPLHELAHIWEHYLTDNERKVVLEWTGQDDNGWNRGTSEAFARGFEKYLSEGSSSNVSLSDIFAKFKEWLTDIYKGIFGSEIDIELNDKMREIYSTMLGTNFRENVFEEINGEIKYLKDADIAIKKYELESQNLKITDPIPVGSTFYWSHLSRIQKAFINKEYDQLLKEGKTDEKALRELILSTQTSENAGLSMDLVDQALFRNSRQDLIDDKVYWVSFPDTDSDDFNLYVRTIREIVSSGALLDSINNNIVAPAEASRILRHSGVIGIKEEKAIKDKLKELEDLQEQSTNIEDSADSELDVNKEIVMKEVKKIASRLPNSIYVSALSGFTDEQSFDEIMKAIAEQANDAGTYDSTVKMVGSYIVNTAQRMYPDAAVEGDDLIDTVSRENLASMPDVEDIDDSNISVGDLVSFKDKILSVEDIVFGETADDNMYYLSDGSMKFNFQIKKQRGNSENLSENLDMVSKFNVTDPEIFYYLESEDGKEGELVDPDLNDKALDYVGLKTILERLNQKFNNVIKYKIVASDEDFKGRFSNGIVYINLKKYDKTTPFHEYLHPFIEVLKKDNFDLYSNLARELANSDEGREIIDSVKASPFYSKSTKDEIGDEALVRYISKKASDNINSKGRRLKNKYASALERLVEKFRQWFSKLWTKKGMVLQDVSSIPVTANLQDIADLLSIHDMTIDLSERINLINNIEKYQVDALEKAETFEEATIKRIKSKLAVLEDTARRRQPDDYLLSEVVQVRGILKNPDPVESLTNYSQHAVNALDFAGKLFTSINNKLTAANGNLTKEDLIQQSKDLETIKNVVTFYSDAVKYLEYNSDSLSEQEYNFYRKVIDKSERVLNNIKNTSVNITAEWLYPLLERHNNNVKDKNPNYVISKEKLKNSLYSADNDIDQAFYLLGSVGSSKDPVSGIIRSALYATVEENHLFEADILENVKTEYDRFLKEKGITNSRKDIINYFKNNYLRKASVRYIKEYDADKNPVYAWAEHWAFKQKYNYDLFDKARTEFMEDKAIFGETGFDDTNQSHIDKLIKWESQNGTIVQIGTKKEYSGEKGEEVLVDVPITKLEPNDKYLNQDFEALKNDKFFSLLVDKYEEANNKLGDAKLMYGIVPQVSKGSNMFAEYKDKTPMQKIKTVGGKAFNFFIAPKAEEDTNARLLENLDGSKYYSIKGSHNVLLEEGDLDLALPETVVKFAGSANLNSLKAEINPIVKVVKSLFEDNPVLKQSARRVNQKTADGRTIFDKVFKRPALVEKQRVRINEQLVEFINDVMYGENSIETNVNAFGRTISLNKLGNNWAFLTALNNMAFNINAAIGNLFIGKTQLFIESTGGKHFNKSDYMKAEFEYNSNFKNFIQDAFRLQKSKITQLGIKYDAIQGEFRDRFGKKFVGNITERYANGDTLFLLNHAAEHEIQLKGMLSLMNATKVPLKDGTGSVSLYDAHYVDEAGILRMRDDVEWSKESNLDFINKWHAVNKRLNGNYSVFDKSSMQRRWYGQLALIYRKFIYTSIRNRFTKEYYDYELGNVDFGYQRKFFSKLYSDIKDYKFEAAQRFFTKNGWNADERYAYNKTLTEFAFLAGTSILAAIIASAEEGDDESSNASKALLLYTLRFRNDLAMFTIFGVPDVVKILKNPSAILMTMEKYAAFFEQLVTDPTGQYEKKTGSFNKGEYKLKAKLFKALPLVKQWINFTNPADQLAYYNVLKDK